MRSPPLFCHEIADGALGGDTERCPRAFGLRRGCDQPLGDEAIEHARLVQRYEPSHGSAMVSDGHLLAVTHDAQVVAQAIAELSDSCFHPSIMALSAEKI